MKNYYLFIDGSTNPKTKRGVGAFLFLNEKEFDSFSAELFIGKIISKKFELTSSTKLEIENLLWALSLVEEEIIDKKNSEIFIYSDSQNINNLLLRRKKLEGNQFRSAKNKELNNADLYKHFFQLVDKLNLTFIKVKGHLKTSEKKKEDIIFTLVDKASRKILRNSVKNL